MQRERTMHRADRDIGEMICCIEHDMYGFDALICKKEKETPGRIYV